MTEVFKGYEFEFSKYNNSISRKLDVLGAIAQDKKE
jgi:hypothetical protein